MTAKPEPYIEIALLHQLLGGNEPLLGDLLEECPRRSRAWFWRQVVFILLVRAITVASATLREPQRLGEGLAAFAMFIVLSFQVVVAGSLLDDLIPPLAGARVIRINHPEWLMFVVLLSLPVAWFTGRATSRLHGRSRVATVLVCGASAAVVASMTVSVLSSEATGFFFPSAAHQTAAAMMFVLALRSGARPLHDRRA